jgi:hypothetical protein
MSDIYGTLADATAYHAARGNVAWAASGVTDDRRNVSLLKATEFIDTMEYLGVKTGGRSQERAWPRTGVVADGETVADDTVPREIEYATYEAALLDLTGTDLQPNEARAGAVKRKRVKAGPAEVETEYMDWASSGTEFTKINNLLSVFTSTMYGASYELLRV